VKNVVLGAVNSCLVVYRPKVKQHICVKN